MTATFGKLQGRSLELGDGLNIIEAPNETGKSTWCAFLLSILYGVNSRERDRAGFIADKNRFAPWSGAAMSGRMDCGTELGELTLTRATRRQTSPMGEFSAVYAGTNEPVPGLTGAACGETLLGISREVFERSAFIRQNNLPISQDAELERRIAALISSGEEGTSYTEAADALKKQLNRRRHNRTGQLPALETELAELDRQLSESNSLARQLVQARSEVEALSRRAEILQAELTDCNRWEAAQRRQALSGAASAAEQAEVRAAQVQERLQQDQIPENETIARLRGAIVNLETTRRAADKARSERDEAMKALLRAEAAVNESPFAGQSPESARREAAGTENEPVKWNPVPGVLTFLIGVPLCFVVTYAVLFLTGSHSKLLALLTMLAGFSCVCALALFLKKRAFQAGWAELRLKRFGTADLDAIRQLAEDYAKLCEARDAAQASVNAKSAAADTLYSSLSSNEQGILLEVRRFAPDAFDIPTADQLLRACAVRRKELAEAETAAREARMRYELQVQQAPAPGTPEADVPARPEPGGHLHGAGPGLRRTGGGPLLRGPSGRPAPRRGRSRGAAGFCRGPGCPKGAAGNGVQRSPAGYGGTGGGQHRPAEPLLSRSGPPGSGDLFPTDRQPLCRCGAGPELPPLGRACGRPGVPGCRPALRRRAGPAVSGGAPGHL